MKVSILCDAENQQPLNIDFVYEILKSLLAQIDGRVFGDQKLLSKKWRKTENEFGFKIIDTPHQNYKKDIADRELAKHAVKIVPNIDLLIIVTGDSDFKLTICTLKVLNPQLIIIGMGSGNNVSRIIQEECDHFADLSDRDNISSVLNKLI